eukprot:2491352-Alexandrium_andersonii.AAC.1
MSADRCFHPLEAPMESRVIKAPREIAGASVLISPSTRSGPLRPPQHNLALARAGSLPTVRRSEAFLSR